MNYIEEYYGKIQSGEITVGRWVELCYSELTDGIRTGKYLFDEAKALKAIEFIERYCHHTEGVLAPGLIKLELWQKAMLSAMFGIVEENGHRRFREILLIVARKNGKSLFAASIAQYIFFVDGGFGTRIYNLAPKLDQAEIIYNDIWQSIMLEPELLETKEEKDPNSEGIARARHRMTDLYIERTNSTVKKIAFSARKSDGFNPSLTVCDEIAAWQGDQGLKQYEVMKSGMGARPEGMLLSCSTAGYVSDSIYDELLKRSTRFLLGESEEKRLLPFLYIIDDVDKWDDMAELRKSNPNLGVSVTEEYLTEEIAIARGSLSKKAEFLTKYCNVKQNSSLAWLSASEVEGVCGEELNIEDFRSSYCVGGIDLSQTTDLTSCCAVIEKGGRLFVFSHFFMPRNRLEQATLDDGMPYDIYRQQGLLTLSGENFVDYHDCYAWFTRLVEEYEILPLQIGYDRYSAKYLIQDMSEYGFHCDDVFQGTNLTPVIREAEGLIRDGLINIGTNNLLKAHLLNSALKTDVEGRVKLIKLGVNTRIDGTAALLDALCVRQKWYGELGSRLKNEE